ncbi:hypothetical protein PG993_010794 [Apiospora rasikravindrae]|uniref:BTB domain-containing protein n=1 Tax=Apiospora rasikravindrae TaxID=990691 RepID=A0ABR1SDZ0_9PEZI
MGITRYDIDQEGDIELILRNPNVPFAEWHEDLPDEWSFWEPLAGGKRMAKKSKGFARLFKSLDPGYEPEGLPLAANNAKDVPASESHDITTADDGVEIHMRLSSKHLILASTYFQKMLQGPWEESKTRTLEAFDWDADAMLILMNIIHGRTRRVFRSISLEMLAKIASLVDYYDCHEIVELYADCWISNLKHNLPKEYSRDLVLWLSISCVFSQGSLFQTLTKVVMKEARGPLPTLNLPIPQHIVDALDQRRQKSLDGIISGLHDLLSYFDSRTSCSFECSSILLGALTGQMQRRGFLNPKPTRPYLGYSVAETTKALCSFKSPEWASRRGRFSDKHRCSLDNFMDATVKSIGDDVEGLKLEEKAF